MLDALVAESTTSICSFVKFCAARASAQSLSRHGKSINKKRRGEKIIQVR